MTDDELKELWLSFAEDYCNKRFDRNRLPGGVQLYLKSKFDNANKDASIQSKKLSDMSITYFSKKEMSDDEKGLLNPYKSMKVI